jgi:hypothetical protein
MGCSPEKKMVRSCAILAKFGKNVAKFYTSVD